MEKVVQVPGEVIEKQIFLIRGCNVMISTYLAALYGVQARTLVQAVKRNINRFPDDFMFQLNDDEYENLKSQFVISSWGGARRANPYAFTEQGVAMLSSVLNSERAVQVNIAIMRIFVKLKQVLLQNADLALKLSEHENKVDRHEVHIQVIFEEIRKLMEPLPEKPKRRIGFRAG